MTTVPRLSLLAVSMLAVAILATACSSSTTPEPTPSRPSTPLGVVVLDPWEKPDLVIPDTDGTPYNLRARTEGKFTLIYLGYTFCPDLCPLEMAELSAGLQMVDPAIRDRVEVVFITVDPERDKPAVLAKWLSLFDASFIGLVPKPGEVPDIAKAFGMDVPQRSATTGEYYTMSHSAFVRGYLTDNLNHYIFPAGFSPEAWKHDIELLVNQEENFIR